MDVARRVSAGKRRINARRSRLKCGNHLKGEANGGPPACSRKPSEFPPSFG
jgi:hypothetical protein